MIGCYYQGLPFPALIGLGLRIRQANDPNAELINCPEKAGFVDEHRHFDPMRKLQKSLTFNRLTSIEFKTVNRKYIS